MGDRQDDDAKPDALSAAADTIVRELASYAVLFAVSWALLNRDAVTRAWMRLTARPVSAAEARALRLTAELQRAVSEWEHRGDRAPKVPGGGLYGGR